MAKTLLVIDDEQSITTIIARIAGALGFQVVAVNKADKALEAVSRLEPDILMIDMVMPGMDGVDILRQVAALDFAAKIKIIAMSGFGAGYLRLAKAVAALECRFEIGELAKPFRRADVVRALSGDKPATAVQTGLWREAQEDPYVGGGRTLSASRLGLSRPSTS